MNDNGDEQLPARLENVIRKHLTCLDHLPPSPHPPHMRRAEIHNAISAGWSLGRPPTAEQLESGHHSGPDGGPWDLGMSDDRWSRSLSDDDEEQNRSGR